MDSREKLLEVIARGICVGEMMNEDDVLGGWRHWIAAAEGALAYIAENGFAVVPREMVGKSISITFVNSQPSGYIGITDKPPANADVVIDISAGLNAINASADLSRPVVSQETASGDEQAGLPRGGEAQAANLARPSGTGEDGRPAPRDGGADG